MPRFLNTDNGEFKWHDDPTRVRYAILSHTWRSTAEGGEQSYEDVRQLQSSVRTLPSYSPEPALVANTPDDPFTSDPEGRTTSVLDHPGLSGKIRHACRIARNNGFRLIWIDSCCIDKSSSAELSEVINSMYELYRLSDMCYVYLADVSDSDIPSTTGSAFRYSRWHKRGWTLQELIAPESVTFLTNTWCFLGTRSGLASTLEEITKISAEIMVGRANAASFSVAQRMSWASMRETTRVEDRAYSLLGIFGVHLSPIYGEGENAFFRLQEEITKTLPDQSIFAWGTSCTLRSLTQGEVSGWIDPVPNLLAPSPWFFSRFLSNNIIPLSPALFASRLAGRATEDVPPLHSVFTPQGVRVQLLCVDLTQIPQIFDGFSEAMDRAVQCTECKRLGHAHMLALLQCEDSFGSLIALPLCQPRPDADEQHCLTVATHIDCGRLDHEPFHVVRLTREALVEALPHLLPAPVEVSILSRQRQAPIRKAPIRKSRRKVVASVNLWPWRSSRDKLNFQLAPWCVTPLAALGFTISPPEYVYLTETKKSVLEWMINEMAVTTRIVSSVGEPGQTEPQHILDLQIHLRQIGQATGRRSGSDTEARIAICYHSLGMEEASARTTSGEGELDRYRFPKPTGARVVRLQDQRISTFNSQFPSNTTLASAEFAVHLQSSLDSEDGPVDTRLFYAALELPFESLVKGDTHSVLWLNIDFSERTLPTVTGQTGDPAGAADAAEAHGAHIRASDSPTGSGSSSTAGPSCYAVTTEEDTTCSSHSSVPDAGEVPGTLPCNSHMLFSDDDNDNTIAPIGNEPALQRDKASVAYSHAVDDAAMHVNLENTPEVGMIDAQGSISQSKPPENHATTPRAHPPPAESVSPLFCIRPGENGQNSADAPCQTDAGRSILQRLEALQHENDVMATQIAALTAQNASLSLQMAQIMAQLNATGDFTTSRESKFEVSDNVHVEEH